MNEEQRRRWRIEAREEARVNDLFFSREAMTEEGLFNALKEARVIDGVVDETTKRER